MIYVITGPPCAGKSTWVRERARPGDVVVDLDRIALAITAESTPHHEYPKHIRLMAVAVRKQLVQMAMSHGRRGDSYIINSKPSKFARAQYKKASAQFIEVSAPVQVLMERAKAERPEWVQGAIRSWWIDEEMD